MFAVACELPCIAQQVVEQHVHQHRVGDHRHVARDLDRDRAPGRLGLQVADHRFGDARQIDRLPAQGLPGDAGEVDQCVDQDGHALGTGADAHELVAVALVQARPGLFGEDAREAVDRAQRRAQVVRHRVGEGLQLAHRGLELGGARAHPRLELLVEVAQAEFGDLARGDVVDGAGDPALLAAAVAQRAAGDPHPADLAGERAQAQLVAPLLAIPGQQGADRVARAQAVVGMEEVGQGMQAGGLELEAGEVLPGVV